MDKGVEKYEIAARMCGLQNCFERLKYTNNLLAALFWFVVFSLRYPITYITYTGIVPDCADCKRCIGVRMGGN